MKRIIFTGKGGVGKTTILSTVARLLSRDSYKVLMVDCDPSMNLAMSMGIPLSRVIALTDDENNLHEKLGANLVQAPDKSDTKIDLTLEDYVLDAADGVKIIVMGTIPHGGSGCLCSPISLVKFLIGHPSQYMSEFDFIMVDSQAGVEILGRGLPSEFDLSIVITEPTPKSVEVAKHSMRLSRDLGVKKQMVVVNMAESDDEFRSVSESLEMNGDLLGSVRYDLMVAQSDKNGVHILDYAPTAMCLQDIENVKSRILEA